MNRPGPVSPSRRSLLMMVSAVASSSTCSAMNQSSTPCVAWSFNSTARSASLLIRSVTCRSCSSTPSKVASGDFHSNGGLSIVVEGHPSTTLDDVTVELEGVRRLFLILDLHPVRHARQALVLEVRGHGQVEVGRIQLGVDLVVEGLLHAVIQHDDPPCCWLPATWRRRLPFQIRIATNAIRGRTPGRQCTQRPPKPSPGCRFARRFRCVSCGARGRRGCGPVFMVTEKGRGRCPGRPSPNSPSSTCRSWTRTARSTRNSSRSCPTTTSCGSTAAWSGPGNSTTACSSSSARAGSAPSRPTSARKR